MSCVTFHCLVWPSNVLLQTQYIISVLVIAGIFGGIFTSVSGSGLDICSFSILTLLFRVTEKTATPTSVILMAGNTVVGFFWRVVSVIALWKNSRLTFFSANFRWRFQGFSKPSIYQEQHQNNNRDLLPTIKRNMVNGLNPGLSVICLAWSSGWR